MAISSSPSWSAVSPASWLVHVDIDDAECLGHLLELIRNIFKGLTNPYQVREVLIRSRLRFCLSSHRISPSLSTPLQHGSNQPRPLGAVFGEYETAFMKRW